VDGAEPDQKQFVAFFNQEGPYRLHKLIQTDLVAAVHSRNVLGAFPEIDGFIRRVPINDDMSWQNHPRFPDGSRSGRPRRKLCFVSEQMEFVDPTHLDGATPAPPLLFRLSTIADDRQQTEDHSGQEVTGSSIEHHRRFSDRSAKAPLANVRQANSHLGSRSPPLAAYKGLPGWGQPIVVDADHRRALTGKDSGTTGINTPDQSERLDLPPEYMAAALKILETYEPESVQSAPKESTSTHVLASAKVIDNMDR